MWYIALTSCLLTIAFLIAANVKLSAAVGRLCSEKEELIEEIQAHEQGTFEMADGYEQDRLNFQDRIRAERNRYDELKAAYEEKTETLEEKLDKYLLDISKLELELDKLQLRELPRIEDHSYDPPAKE